MHIEETTSAPPRRRAMREDVRRSRAALQLLRPLQRDVSSWQAEIARLISGAERLRLRREHDAVSLEKAAALERTILAARHALTERLAGAPPDISSDGRVLDVRRAIDSALAGLSQVKRLMH